MGPMPRKNDPLFRSLPPSEVMQALRGIWKMDGEMVVVEVDQEKNVLIASTYEGEAVDPKPVLQKGTQVQAFQPHANGT